MKSVEQLIAAGHQLSHASRMRREDAMLVSDLVGTIEAMKAGHLRELNAYESTVQNQTCRIEALAAELLSARAELERLRAQEPIGSFHIRDQQVEATTDYIKDGEWPIDDGEIRVYAEPKSLAVPLPDGFRLITLDALGAACGALQRHAPDSNTLKLLRRFTFGDLSTPDAYRAAMLQSGNSPDHPALTECCEFLGVSSDSDQAQRLVAGLGYAVEYRELRACDYGAPTIRKRFFMVMRCDGQPISWPDPTHGDPKSPAVQAGRLAPWRTAAECIDWEIPCQSIFGRKRPLAENTLKRIARGIQRFVLDSAAPFIVKCNHTSSRSSYDCFRGQRLDEPLQTITKKHGYAIAIPHLTKFRTGATGLPVTEPVPTVTAGTSVRPGGNGHALGMVEAQCVPFIAGAGGPKYSANPRSIKKPMHTLCNTNHACVIAPVIARQFGSSVGHRVDEPSATVTAGGGGKSQLISAFLAKHYGGNYQGSGVDMNDPVHSVTTVDHHAVVAAHLLVNNTGHPGGAADTPTHTVTTGNHHAVVSSHLVKLRGTCRDGQPTSRPMPTITAGGTHVGEVRTVLTPEENSDECAQMVRNFLRKYCGEDCRPFVVIGGVTYQIVDIAMRMLQPAELYRAQGFPEWYIIDQDYRGKRYSKAAQVARCGNAVPPPFAEALVRANLPELCSQKDAAA